MQTILHLYNDTLVEKLAHTGCFWTLVSEVKCLGCLDIENTKKRASTQLLIYVSLNVAGLFY